MNEGTGGNALRSVAPAQKRFTGNGGIRSAGGQIVYRLIVQLELIELQGLQYVAFNLQSLMGNVLKLFLENGPKILIPFLLSYF